MDERQDNFNVDILFSAIERKKEAEAALKSGVTRDSLIDYTLFERIVAERALWLRDRALTHALEYLSEPTA